MGSFISIGFVKGHISGSDCANFVLQVLYAGGVEANEYWDFHWDYSHFDDRDPVATASWINVGAQLEYLKDNGYVDDIIEVTSSDEISECVEEDGILKGDLMYLVDGIGAHHALVITDIKEGEIYISAHSNDHINYRVSDKFLGTNNALIVKMH